MNDELVLEVVAGDRLTAAERAAVLALCSQAYGEDYEPYLKIFRDPLHVLAWLAGELVSHALWITRWLQIQGGPLLRTAYVEAVATTEAQRGRGFASAVMQHLAAQIGDYDMGALSPADTTLYARLGWEYWQGPLFTRTAAGWQPDPPEERVMILRLPNTPALDLYVPLSVEWREGEVW
jgi:GNAT superfamily N-acetyltransferase